MNASQLHTWVLRNLTPLQHASTDRQGELIGGDAPNFDYWIEVGRHTGLHEASRLLLDLITEMFDQERAALLAQWEAEDAADAVTLAENGSHA